MYIYIYIDVHVYIYIYMHPYRYTCRRQYKDECTYIEMYDFFTRSV